MAEENITDAGSAPSDGGGIDQGSFINDAFAGWVNGGDKEEAKQPNQQEQPKAQTPKPTQQPNAATPQAQTPKDAAQPGAQPPKQESKPDLLSAFTKDGEFDLKGFSSFAAPKEAPQSNINIPQQQAQQPPKEETPIWKQRLEEARKYEEDTKKVVLGWSQEIRALVQQGYTPEQAVLKLESDYEQKVNQHLTNWKAEREYKFREDDEKTVAEKSKAAEESARLESLAKVNTAKIIAGLPGETEAAKTELFNQILFSQEVGAPILNYEFERAYPDHAKMTPEQLDKTAREFLQRISGDYRALSYYFERALDRAARMNIPKINEKVAAATEAATKANKQAAQRSPRGTLGRSQQPEQSAKGWESYFRNPAEMADRIN